MTQPDLLSWREAEQRRDDGMARAVEHADGVLPSWSDMALSGVLHFLLCNDGAPFLAEDARTWVAAIYELPPPPDGRAWGAVFQRAARAGHIVKAGYGAAKSSNCSPKCLWKGAEA